MEFLGLLVTEERCIGSIGVELNGEWPLKLVAILFLFRLDTGLVSHYCSSSSGHHDGYMQFVIYKLAVTRRQDEV